MADLPFLAGPGSVPVFAKDNSFQFDILGGNVNTAFNLCDSTEPNEIILSNEAWMSARSDLEVKSKGLMKLKSDSEIEVLELLNCY